MRRFYLQWPYLSTEMMQISCYYWLDGRSAAALSKNGDISERGEPEKAMAIDCVPQTIDHIDANDCRCLCNRLTVFMQRILPAEISPELRFDTATGKKRKMFTTRKVAGRRGDNNKRGGRLDGRPPRCPRYCFPKQTGSAARRGAELLEAPDLGGGLEHNAHQTRTSFHMGYFPIARRTPPAKGGRQNSP